MGKCFYGTSLAPETFLSQEATMLKKSQLALKLCSSVMKYVYWIQNVQRHVISGVWIPGPPLHIYKG